MWNRSFAKFNMFKQFGFFCFLVFPSSTFFFRIQRVFSFLANVDFSSWFISNIPDLSFELKIITDSLLKSCLFVNEFIIIYSLVFIGKHLYARPSLCLASLCLCPQEVTRRNKQVTVWCAGLGQAPGRQWGLIHWVGGRWAQGLNMSSVLCLSVSLSQLFIWSVYWPNVLKIIWEWEYCFKGNHE